MTKPEGSEDQVFAVRPGDWQVFLKGIGVLPTFWNSKGAAEAGLRVERRRFTARQKLAKEVYAHYRETHGVRISVQMVAARFRVTPEHAAAVLLESPSLFRLNEPTEEPLPMPKA